MYSIIASRLQLYGLHLPIASSASILMDFASNRESILHKVNISTSVHIMCVMLIRIYLAITYTLCISLKSVKLQFTKIKT